MKYTNGKRRTLALGTIAALSVGVAGCEANVQQPLPIPADPIQFTNPTECISAGYAMQACHDAFEAAVTKHNEKGPRYAQQQVCEEDWGVTNCREVSNGGGNSSFMPFMMGYLLSSTINDSSRGYYRVGSHYGAPIYRGLSGPVQFDGDIDIDIDRKKKKYQGYSSGGYATGYAGPRGFTPVTAKKPSISANHGSVQRGGFGSSMSSRGSFGG